MRAGVDAGVAGARALDAEAAVGLANRSAELLLNVAFLTGVGNGMPAARDRAKDAAVGANRPEDGVFGLDTPVAAGILGRDADGVFERLDGGAVDAGRGALAGVDTPALLVADRVDVPVCCGLSGTCAEGGERGDRMGVPVLDAVEGAVRGDLTGVAFVDFLAAVGLLVVVAGLRDFSGSTIVGGESTSAVVGSGSSSGVGSSAGSEASSAAGGVIIAGGETDPGFKFS